MQMMSPWTRADAVMALVVVAVGAVVWFVGWWEVSDRASLDSQIALLNVAVLGVLVIGAGQTLWFLRGRRAVHERRRLLLGADTMPRATTSEVVLADRYVGAGRFYHRPECAMVADRDWSASARAGHERAGRIPCGVCTP